MSGNNVFIDDRKRAAHKAQRLRGTRSDVAFPASSNHHYHLRSTIKTNLQKKIISTHPINHNSKEASDVDSVAVAAVCAAGSHSPIAKDVAIDGKEALLPVLDVGASGQALVRAGACSPTSIPTKPNVNSANIDVHDNLQATDQRFDQLL